MTFCHLKGVRTYVLETIPSLIERQITYPTAGFHGFLQTQFLSFWQSGLRHAGICLQLFVCRIRESRICIRSTMTSSSNINSSRSIAPLEWPPGSKKSSTSQSRIHILLAALLELCAGCLGSLPLRERNGRLLTRRNRCTLTHRFQPKVSSLPRPEQAATGTAHRIRDGQLTAASDPF